MSRISLSRQSSREKSEMMSDSLPVEYQSLRIKTLTILDERDKLRLEVGKLRAKLEEAYTMVDEISVETEYDIRGQLTRKVWLAEEKAQKALEGVEEAEGLYHLKVSEMNDALEEERKISSGLRVRIGKLEEKVRSGRAGAEKMQAEFQDRQKKLDSAWMKDKEELRRVKSDNQDLKERLRRQSNETTRLDEKDRGSPAKFTNNDEKAVDATDRTSLRSPLSNLTKPNSNTIPYAPTTPPKPSLSTTKSPTPTPTSMSINLTHRYAVLEDTHKSLKAEYDKLKSLYESERKYLQEFKAFEIAKKEVRRKKIAEKRASRDKGREVGEEVLVPPSSGSQAAVQSKKKDSEASLGRTNSLVGVNEDEEDDEGELTAKEEEYDEHGASLHQLPHEMLPTPRPSTRHIPLNVSLPHREANAGSTSPKPSTTGTTPKPSLQGVVHPRQTSPERPQTNMPTLAGTSAATTPIQKKEKKTIASASRVTPWLGPTKSKEAITLQGDRDSFEDEIGIISNRTPNPTTPMHSSFDRTATTSSHKPLIRDRTGTPLTNQTSLRRTALERSVARPAAPNDTDHHGSPILLSTATRINPKRKLEMSDLTPAQKAVTRKKISKLSIAEKRELYAPYKGKGRYLAPDEIKTRVEDEYEINPDLNEGQSFVFHDVKRKREERMKMHGGDCECCKDYYKSIGDIPRYNVGPVWRDATQHDVDGEGKGEVEAGGEARQHQDKVSRHRETWVKAPTPPGFWQIGFPTTQAVLAQNRKADIMDAEKQAQLRRDTAHKDSKWRKKRTSG